jgi:short-subunit dehydrogenase
MTSQTQSTATGVNPADPRHVLVVGAGPGIGIAVARRFAREGYRLTLVSRDVTALEERAAELRATDATVDVLGADAADATAYRAVVETLYAASSPPGVVVYNAALLGGDGLLTSTVDHLASAYVVDVLSAIVTAQVAVPALRAAGGGTILLTGGGAADNPHHTYATISLGKSALRAVGTMLADELADDAIHVASVTVSGRVAPGTEFDPDLIADTYWTIHTEPRGQWKSVYPFSS